MLSEQVKRALNCPETTPVSQGQDTYPRVITQTPHGDNHMLVTFAMPGLRRQRMLVPVATWIASGHLDCHDAMLAQAVRLLPPPTPDETPPFQ